MISRLFSWLLPLLAVALAAAVPGDALARGCLDYQDFLRWEGTVYGGGYCGDPHGWHDLQIKGDLGFGASYCTGLEVIDFSSPDSPQIVAELDSGIDPRRVALCGSLALLAGINYEEVGLFQIVDVANPLAPGLRGELLFGGQCTSVSGQGNFAFVGVSGTGTLFVVDITDPDAPFVVTSLPVAGASDQVCAGNHIFLAAGYGGLQIIDISTPTAPFLAGGADTPGYAHNLALEGTLVHVADCDGGLQIIDVSNVSAPFVVGSLPTYYAFDVCTGDGLLFLADHAVGLKVIDAADPAAPQLLGEIPPLGHYAGTVGYLPGHVAVGHFSSHWMRPAGIHVFDVTYPTTPSHFGVGSTPQIPTCLTVAGDFAYAGAGPYLYTLDVSNPAAPVLVDQQEPGGGIGALEVAGDLLVVKNWSWLRFFDLTDPAAPLMGEFIMLPTSAWDLAVAGTLAYVACREEGLQIVDFSDPGAPFIAGSVATPEYALGVAVGGGYAYVGGDGLFVYDLTDPIAPVYVGEVEAPAWGDMEIAGGLAVLATGHGIQVLDLGDPAAPVLLGSEGAPYDAGGSEEVAIVEDLVGRALVVTRVQARDDRMLGRGLGRGGIDRPGQ